MATLEELDETTLRRAMRGEPQACRRFVERYQSLVYALAHRILGRASADAADVAQESFLRAFDALGAFDPRGPRVSTWLATITTRVAIDHVRKRRTVVSLDEVRNAVDLEARDPGERLDEARRRERLSRALERLAPEQRAAIVLRVEHNLSYEDIARALEIELGTVKSRLARAQTALREALTESSARNDHG